MFQNTLYNADVTVFDFKNVFVMCLRLFFDLDSSYECCVFGTCCMFVAISNYLSQTFPTSFTLITETKDEQRLGWILEDHFSFAVLQQHSEKNCNKIDPFQIEIL